MFRPSVGHGRAENPAVQLSVFTSASPRLSLRAKPSSVWARSAAWGAGHCVQCVFLVVVQAPGQACSPTSVPSFCSPRQQRCSGQGLSRKQTASALPREAEKRIGTRKGLGKQTSWAGQQQRAPCQSAPRPSTLGGPTRQFLRDIQMRTDLGTHTGSFPI